MKHIRRRAWGILKSAAALTRRHFCEPLERRIFLDGGPEEVVPAPEGEDTNISFRVDTDGESGPTYQCIIQDWGR